ncbi:MAG: hypothetical protein KDN05_02270 [Verrucomicrobiae bacterium]|nr:hypothetical protein [Verrucomicrobiae bacterium]
MTIEGPAHNGLTREVILPAERFIMRKPVWAAKRAAEKSKAAMATLDGLVYISGLVREKQFKIIPARMDEVGATKKVRHIGLKHLVEIGLVEITEDSTCAGKTVRLLF